MAVHRNALGGDIGMQWWAYHGLVKASGYFPPVTDEVIEVTKTKYMPAVKAMGAIDCEIVQTGLDSSILIATYADKAAADVAAEKAAALRAESKEEFKAESS